MGLKRICSQCFRDALASHFKGLKKEEYWRHLRRLIYASDYENIPISQLHIAFDFKVMNKYINGDFAAINYIDEFRASVYSYEVTTWDFSKHRCRYASVNFSPYLLQLIQDEIMGKLGGPKVIMTTGNIVNKDTRTAFRKEDKLAAELANKNRDYHPLSDKFLNYFNSLPYHRFTKMCKHIPEALGAIENKDENGNYIIKLQEQFNQRLILQTIEEQPQPFYVYTNTGNTIRLFELNKGLQGVHSSLRKILTQDCIEVDIQNAHLAIVATLWNIPEIQAYLSTGQSIWASLIPAMGFSYPNASIKADLKEFFYALVYGMSLSNLKKGMIQTFGKAAYNLFMQHPLIKSLLAARKRRTSYILSKKEHITYLGTATYPQQYWNKEEGKLKSNIPTILSQEVGEFEMLLLEPILDLAIESGDFTVVLYQFDGLSLQFEYKNRIRNLLPKLKALVEERANSMGIITTLTY